MINALFGIKKGMTSSYDNRGRRVGATIIAIQPAAVSQIKNNETDGYTAVQIALGTKKTMKKPQLGTLKKAGIEQSARYFREVRTESLDDIQPGQQITVDQVFSLGDTVKVTGTSKGRGFQGGMRRHGFHGGPKTHGQSDRHRAPGSVGSGTTPGRVLKGKKMAGHMGVDTVTVANLEIIALDKVNGLITVKGGIPGPMGQLVRISNTGNKVKGFVAPSEPEPEIEEVIEQEAASTEETAETSAEEIVSEPVAIEESASADSSVTGSSADAEEAAK